MKKIDVVLGMLEENGEVEVYNLGKGVFVKGVKCTKESIIEDFCPENFGLKDCEHCSPHCDCEECWDEEM